uniref:Putative secreted protein n=1 Tax=Ixodes ricinus TaxID=34613 RepID=A0A6B0V8Y5_IXORI
MTIGVRFHALYLVAVGWVCQVEVREGEGSRQVVLARTNVHGTRCHLPLRVKAGVGWVRRAVVKGAIVDAEPHCRDAVEAVRSLAHQFKGPADVRVEELEGVLARFQGWINFSVCAVYHVARAFPSRQVLFAIPASYDVIQVHLVLSGVDCVETVIGCIFPVHVAKLSIRRGNGWVEHVACSSQEVRVTVVEQLADRVVHNQLFVELVDDHGHYKPQCRIGKPQKGSGTHQRAIDGDYDVILASRRLLPVKVERPHLPVGDGTIGVPHNVGLHHRHPEGVWPHLLQLGLFPLLEKLVWIGEVEEIDPLEGGQWNVAPELEGL